MRRESNQQRIVIGPNAPAIGRLTTDEDNLPGADLRRAAAHAHVMTHHAMETSSDDAHQAAADAHTRVGEMHTTQAETARKRRGEKPIGAKETPGSPLGNKATAPGRPGTKGL